VSVINFKAQCIIWGAKKFVLGAANHIVFQFGQRFNFAPTLFPPCGIGPYSYGVALLTYPAGREKGLQEIECPNNLAPLLQYNRAGSVYMPT